MSSCVTSLTVDVTQQPRALRSAEGVIAQYVYELSEQRTAADGRAGLGDEAPSAYRPTVRSSARARIGTSLISSLTSVRPARTSGSPTSTGSIESCSSAIS